MGFFRYKKDGYALSLIRVHDALVENAVDYFEKGKDIRRGLKRARKALKKALKLAKKKKINPGLKIGKARDELAWLLQEVEYTHKALLTTATSLENALSRIQKERIEAPLNLIDSAHEHFRNRQIDRGIELLKKSQEKLKEKVLVKSRTALFGGTSNQVTDVRDEIMEFKKKRRQKQKQKNG